jgi:hypothetical protein
MVTFRYRGGEIEDLVADVFSNFAVILLREGRLAAVVTRICGICCLPRFIE